MVEVRSGVRAPSALLAPGALADDAAVDLAGQRLRDDADLRPAVDRQADHHHEAGRRP